MWKFKPRDLNNLDLVYDLGLKFLSEKGNLPKKSQEMDVDDWFENYYDKELSKIISKNKDHISIDLDSKYASDFAQSIGLPGTLFSDLKNRHERRATMAIAKRIAKNLNEDEDDSSDS